MATREDPILGTLKLCAACVRNHPEDDPWWPLDEEFWYRSTRRGGQVYWQAWCRACWGDRNRRVYLVDHPNAARRERPRRFATPEERIAATRERQRLYYETHKAECVARSVRNLKARRERTRAAA